MSKWDWSDRYTMSETFGPYTVHLVQRTLDIQGPEFRILLDRDRIETCVWPWESLVNCIVTFNGAYISVSLPISLWTQILAWIEEDPVLQEGVPVAS